MRKHLPIFKWASIIGLLLLACNNVQAEWKLLKECTAAYGMHITKSGNMLLSDYLFDQTGGIYVSTDGGNSWEKTDVADYNYSRFVEADNYVFAIGKEGNIARSADEGKTWTVVNYTSALEDVLDPKALANTNCYAATIHKGKLFIGDFAGGGVLYSEDFGDTWKLTDREPFIWQIDMGDKGMQDFPDCFYQLVSFKDQLYAFGVYGVFLYDETNNTWTTLRNDSNFMGQSTIFDGTLYCGRSVANETDEDPFLECTSDGKTWEEVKRPAGLIDNNVRSMTSDDKNIYAALQTRGIYFTSNKGESWTKISDGIPAHSDYLPDLYLSPLKLIATDDYVYVLIYDVPSSTRGVSGIYQMPKTELQGGVGALPTGSEEWTVVAKGSQLTIHATEKVSVAVADIYGKVLKTAELQDGDLYIGDLGTGVYLYTVSSDTQKRSGKFLKR